MIAKCQHAKVTGASDVKLCDLGTPQREFLDIDDVYDAMVHMICAYSGKECITMGTGSEVAVAEAVSTVAKVAAFTGCVVSDVSKPDGTPHEFLDVNRLSALGGTARTAVDDGLQLSYRWFHEQGKRR